MVGGTRHHGILRDCAPLGDPFWVKIAVDLRKRRPKPHTIWHLDEINLEIDGRLVNLWRAVDAEGEECLQAQVRHFRDDLAQ
jgi:transposase-like protein